MTIFDTIRYPVSTPITEIEAKSIPEVIWRTWVDHKECSWRDINDSSRYNPRWVSFYMNAKPVDERSMLTINQDLALLRKIIKEWEE